MYSLLLPCIVYLNILTFDGRQYTAEEAESGLYRNGDTGVVLSLAFLRQGGQCVNAHEMFFYRDI